MPIILALLLALLSLLPVACSRSAGTDADAGAPPRACSKPDCRLDEGERCQPCFEQLGRCCYQDATLLGKGTALAAACETRDDCRRCCSECAARSCEAIRAAGDCPNLPR